MSESYSSCGWPVTFKTETAASDRDGTAIFYTDEASGVRVPATGKRPALTMTRTVGNKAALFLQE